VKESRLLNQFQGTEGKRRIMEIFRNSEIVKQNSELAERLTRKVKLRRYEKGQELYHQEESARGYLYLILSGKVDLIRNGTLITTKGTGQAVGEFPFVNPSLPYTATAFCQERTTVAIISEMQFELITHDYPVLWKNLAESLVRRLNTVSDLLGSPKGSRVFIGHGHSELWRELRDFINGKLGLEWDEFNREPAAGIGITERLSEMLTNAALAFLIFTGEDEQPDSKVRARMNVIHEAGLFQGKLGFRKAIILIEDGCDEFSNIYGLGQIRFPKGKISEIFDEIRDVVKREGLLK
jgi:predicted nucleotide-binding protein